MRQIAALPYRATGADLPAPQVLLVTSRETKRWVVPKGNPIAGLAPHEAAAHEAMEEGGVTGIACPASIGSFRYRKVRRGGASQLIDVDVFPISVTHEMQEWPEDSERERRWFSLAEAAAAVDEPDLSALILGFSATPAAAPAQVKAGVSMFQWFQALLPRQTAFFDLFEAHARLVSAGADALALMLQGGSDMATHAANVVAREAEADTVTREVLQGVRRTFLTPFDRSAIVSLISAMDDAIDQMQQTAGAVSLYEVTKFDDDMRAMAGIIVEAARLSVESLPLLRDIAANAAKLTEMTERLVALENQADGINARGLSRLFKSVGDKETMRFFVNREIYVHLERVMDRFEDVANEINGLVIDHG